MRYLLSTLVLLLPLSLAGATWADDNTEQEPVAAGDRPGPGPELRQWMLEKFDADGDGQLSEAERQAARDQMRDRRTRRGSKQGRGANGFQPPKPEELFQQFDKDGDKKLSMEEFRALTQSMQARRHRGGPRHGKRGRQGPSKGRGNRPGRPSEGQRNFRPQGPLQNQGNRPGPPPLSQDRRGSQGPAGQGPPPPGRLFDHFDRDGNDQLSRDEFFELTETIRERRHHRGARGGPSGEGRRNFRRPGPPQAEEGPAAE